jgi:hypothetical protein
LHCESDQEINPAPADLFGHVEVIMDAKEKHIWFPAKKYGWGWGAPCACQGWVTLAMFVVLLCTAGMLFLPKHFGFWIVSVIVLAIAMFITCLVKGEKPRWHWGND